MKTPLTPADIDWLGRNIPQYCSGAAKLSRNAEARIAQIRTPASRYPMLPGWRSIISLPKQKSDSSNGAPR